MTIERTKGLLKLNIVKKRGLIYYFLGILLMSALNTQAQIGSKLKGALERLSPITNDNITTQKQGTTVANAGQISQLEAKNALKQALSNGLQASVTSLAVQDGFLGDATVKILMPEEAQRVEKTLRAVGMGSLCDQFISSMNRAAETAVSEAGNVFLNSLSTMSISDVYTILLSGEKNAATNYFKTNTIEELTGKFSPIVESAMGTNNVTNYWEQLSIAYNKLPLVKKVEPNLTSYVTGKAIDGLFVKVADQELKIRNNFGGARSTELLSKVFGWADAQK